MKVKTKYVKGILGIALIVLAITGIFLWENYGRQALNNVDVLVMKSDIPKGTMIEKDMLGIMKMDRSFLVSSIVEQPDDIVGKKACIDIPKGLQLSEGFFQEQGLTTGNGNYVFQVPTDWVYAYPQTLRRGDKVFFYPVIDSSTDIEREPGKSQSAIIEAHVAYVKDSANREVVDLTPDRMDGSSQIASIEVVLSNAEHQKIKEFAEFGYRFILAYE